MAGSKDRSPDETLVSAVNESDPEWVVLGRVSGLFGVRGWVKVYSHTAPRTNILKYPVWYLHQADGWMEYRHGARGVQFPRPLDIWGWHVIALRFGVSSGMTLFIDGEVPEGAHDPTDNFPISSFNLATLCARKQGIEIESLGVVWLAEVTAYDGAGSDELVIEETSRLLAKYGLTP